MFVFFYRSLKMDESLNMACLIRILHVALSSEREAEGGTLHQILIIGSLFVLRLVFL